MLEQNNLVERLSLQAESFQEGFEILSKASSFRELTLNFAHLLRGNFIIKDLYLLHKAAEDSEWEGVGLDNKFSSSDLSFLRSDNNLNISYHDQ